MRIVRPLSAGYTLLMAAVLGGGTAAVGAWATPWGAWIGLVPAAVVLAVGLRTPWRRWRLAQQAFPDDWRRWLRAHVPLYARLDPDGRARFERDVQFYLGEHVFDGVEGVEVTDALRLGVAAGAATLLHGRPDWEWPGSRSVVFYPDRFSDDYYADAYAEYDGMAHQQGPVILSAQAVVDSWTHPDDGDNVVLHELAHLLDFDNTGADGVPALLDAGSERSWQALVRREMRRIRRGRSLLRDYGATAPSEFFAVATEVFFEQPHAMADAHPELFHALWAAYRIDPRNATVGMPRDGRYDDECGTNEQGEAPGDTPADQAPVEEKA
jgi:hypothetical protein